MGASEKIKFVVLPIIAAVLSGTFGPMLVEKWKESTEDSKKLLLMEQRIEKIEEALNHLNANLEAKIPHLEHELRDVEVQVSHNAGVLKGRLPKVTPKPIQVSESKK